MNAIGSFSETHPRRAVFLGRDVNNGLQRCWSQVEDSVGIVGPPRYGKTSGLIIPTVLLWDGPVVCTSTRSDIAAFTEAHRQRLAGPDGRVMTYDPFASEPRRPSIRWSPLADCHDPAVCFRRVAAMTAVASAGVENGGHWRAGAASVLRGYFHAAALEKLPFATVRRWLARQETDEPAAILRTSATEGAMWADDLDALRLLGDRERGSFFSVARNCLEATAEPTVLRSCSSTDLDMDQFLSTRSTLFIIGPSHQQQAIAPLLAALVDAIAQRATEVAAGSRIGRLASPLLLALDEVANIAPLHSLPSLVSEGGGRGIVTMWAAQSLAQLRARYGTEQQAAILAATTAKVIFGGMSIGVDLHNVSTWGGELQEVQSTVQMVPSPQSGVANPGDHGIAGGLAAEATRTVGRIYRPALTIDALQMLPPLHAWLFYRSDRPLLVETLPAGKVSAWAALATGGGS